MALTQAEMETVEKLKTEGGEEWSRFRARRNKHMRLLGDDALATRKALEPVMQLGNVIGIGRPSIDDDDVEQLSSRDWSAIARVAVCLIMVILTTGYQIYAQRNLYAEGSEGLFLAAMLDTMLVGLAVLMPTGKLLKAAKFGLIGFVVVHMALTLESAAVESVKAQSPELARLQQRYTETQALYNDVPKSRVSDRMKVQDELGKIDDDIKTLNTDLGGSAAMLGTGSGDIRTRVRWINLIAQLFFAHMLGLIIARELVPHGTLGRLRTALS